MPTTTLTRRALFNKIIGNLPIKSQQTDPLFEKYSRKIFKGRKTSSLNFKSKSINNRTSETERVNPVTSGLAAYTGTWTDREALHLLRRTGFGFKKVNVDTLTSLSFDNAVNTVLNVNITLPSPPVNYYQNMQADEANIPYGADWTNSSFPDYTAGGNTNGYRLQSLRSWSLGLALNHDITIKEKMVLFWYHFIPIDFGIVDQSPNEYVNQNSARICYKYMKMFRDNPTGNFKTLIRNMATQPAMMFYLNNNANTRNAPDENFAREIMELFTIGKDVTNSYAQTDVVQAAKVLTGWRVQNLNTNTEATNFIQNRHDLSTKQFSPFFNNTQIPNSGAAEIDLFINMIFSKSEIVSQYICRRLYRFFVYYDIDANIEANVIVPLAQLFVTSNWNILPVLEKLFKSQHFYDIANRGVYIKSPFDIILGSLRTFNINYNVADPTNHQAQYEIWNDFNYYLFEMQQAMGVIPNVAGWQAFYQQPSFHEYWINSNSIQKRYGLLEYIFYGFDMEKNGLVTRIEVDVIAFAQQFPASVIENPNFLINECVKYLLPVDLSTDQKNIIKFQSLLSTGQPDYYWYDAWVAFIAAPNDASLRNIIKNRLRSMLLTIVQYAEYQLM